MAKYKIQILLWNLFGIILLLSLYYSYRDGFWFNLDSAIFHFFNGFLNTNHKDFLYVIAITNHRGFDLISFLAMFLLYYHYFCHQPADIKRKMLVIGITMLLIAILIKFWGRFIPIAHVSPTLYFEPFEHINRISKLTHFGTKDASSDSFPGDHGMMLMIFAGFMWRYFGLKAFIKAAIIVVIFSAPRIIAGAHWFTDVYVGSFAITSIALSWFLLTPASDYVANHLLRLVPNRLFSAKQ